MGNELYHHGVLGMKWGVRRYQNKDGTLTAAGKKRYGKDDSTEPKHRTEMPRTAEPETAITKVVNNPRHMTDADLQAAINRLTMEKRYADLVASMNAPTPKKQHPYLKRGADFVFGVLERAGNNVIPQAITYYSVTKLNSKIASATGVEEALNPKKGQKDK